VDNEKNPGSLIIKTNSNSLRDNVAVKQKKNVMSWINRETAKKECPSDRRFRVRLKLLTVTCHKGTWTQENLFGKKAETIMKWLTTWSNGSRHGQIAHDMVKWLMIWSNGS
jgi:hypothetical protein